MGTDAERRLAGLTPDTLLAIAAPNNHRLSRVLAQKNDPERRSGRHSRVRCGRSGAEQLRSHTYFPCQPSIALRPRLNHRERAEQVLDVLSYVGDGFDFSFDLTESSDLVCTEVVYRSLQGRGGIDLPLSVHAGRLTLTADDIARYALQNGGEQFNCVLVVDQSPEAAGKARVLHAAEAQERIARLLGIDL